MQNIYNSKNFETAVVVDNYPWGFKLKTKRAYWIETNSKGDRFCYQTLNPKTNKWCAVKCSTYGAAFVLTQDEKSKYVSYFGLSKCDSGDDVEKWLMKVDYNKLNDQQKKQLCKIKAFSETMKKVKISFTNTTSWSDEERAAHKKKQDEINGKLANYSNALYSQCLVRNGLK